MRARGKHCRNVIEQKGKKSRFLEQSKNSIQQQTKAGFFILEMCVEHGRMAHSRRGLRETKEKSGINPEQ